MEKDTRSRKFQLTINNPVENGFNHDAIKQVLAGMKSIIYWCMADEIGKNGTYHTHVYMQGRDALRFSSIKKHFPPAHIEICKGTALQNREYLSKSGKWEKDEKHETSVEGTFEEWGEMPVERQGARNDLADLYSMIKQGMSNYEIMEEAPDTMLYLDDVDKVRQTVIQEKFKNVRRDVTCTYIWGDTGTGKTRSVMDKYGYENVFRITDYTHPFDSYKGQDVVVFEEFRSSLKFGDMLMYTDIYPVELRCRYMNKYACYTKVYIISNVPLSSQYQNLPDESTDALIRRLKWVLHYKRDGVKKERVQFVGNGFRLLFEGEHQAFEVLDNLQEKEENEVNHKESRAEKEGNANEAGTK